MERRRREGEGKEGGRREGGEKAGREDRGKQIIKLALIRCFLFLYEQVGLEKPLISFEDYFLKGKCNFGENIIYTHTHTHT